MEAVLFLVFGFLRKCLGFMGREAGFGMSLNELLS